MLNKPAVAALFLTHLLCLAVLLVNAKQTRCRSFVFNAFAMFGMP
jgi:hypothetical protein